MRGFSFTSAAWALAGIAERARTEATHAAAAIPSKIFFMLYPLMMVSRLLEFAGAAVYARREALAGPRARGHRMRPPRRASRHAAGCKMKIEHLEEIRDEYPSYPRPACRGAWGRAEPVGANYPRRPGPGTGCGQGRCQALQSRVRE